MSLSGEGRTVIVVTHDVEVASRAARVIRMRDGRLVADLAASAGAAGGVADFLACFSGIS